MSGVRRSCETERSSAVFISSLRRSAAVSTTSRLELARLERGGEQRLQRRHDPLGDALAILRGDGRGQRQRADLLAPSLRSAERGPALVAGDHAELDRRRGRADRRGEALRRDRERRVEVGPAEQDAGELGREVGLAAAAVGLDRARAREVGDHAARRGDDDERSQREPVAVVGERQAPDRRQVEEVERGRARERRERGRDRTPSRSRRRRPRTGRRRRARRRWRRGPAGRSAPSRPRSPRRATSSPSSRDGRAERRKSGESVRGATAPSIFAHSPPMIAPWTPRRRARPRRRAHPVPLTAGVCCSPRRCARSRRASARSRTRSATACTSAAHRPACC